MTDSVIGALVVALEASPGDIGLRAHLSQLLLGAGRHSEALQLAEVGLSFQPSDIGLIRVAIAAGDALGLDVSAHRRALDESLSLAATGGENGTVDSEPLAPPGRTQIPATADELLDTWGSVAAPIDPGIGAFSRPGERLDDVGGMQDAKDRLERSFLGPLRDPHLQRAFGKAAGGGLVLWGPPGCGKTFLARALAGELGANFYEIRIDDMLDPGFGNSERKVAAVFDFARRYAPCVLFFDELDAVGQKRSQTQYSGGMRTVTNQLLSEMDGATARNDGVFLLAATNHPWDLDSALVRPGRFDRRILVLPPDRPARRAIFDIHLRDRPVHGSVNTRKLAKMSEGLSGADIRLVVDDATEGAMTASASEQRIVPINQEMLLASLRAVRPSIDRWLATARNYATFANEHGDLDELVDYLAKNRRPK